MASILDHDARDDPAASQVNVAIARPLFIPEDYCAVGRRWNKFFTAEDTEEIQRGKALS